MPNGAIKASEVRGEDLRDVVFSLTDFMGDAERVKKTLEVRGIKLTDTQIETVKEVFANGSVIDPIGPVAGVYETCGPKSRTKLCF